MNAPSARMVLGTIQLGQSYGIGNTTGRPDEDEALRLVRTAWDGGVRAFDTAQAYGESEAVLGRCLSRLGIAREAQVTSKIAPALDIGDPGVLDAALDSTLERLGQERLTGLMLHREQQLDQWSWGVGDWFQQQKRRGRVGQVGVSVYTPQRALQALALPGVDFIQAPANALDRRLDEAGCFTEARRRGKAVQIRSVFLQGLLLTSAGDPGTAAFAGTVLEEWRALVRESGRPALEVALGYVLAKWPDARIVFGAERAVQVRESLEVRALDMASMLFRTIDARMRCMDERVVRPDLWKLTERSMEGER